MFFNYVPPAHLIRFINMFVLLKKPRLQMRDVSPAAAVGSAGETLISLQLLIGRFDLTGCICPTGLQLCFSL